MLIQTTFVLYKTDTHVSINYDDQFTRKHVALVDTHDRILLYLWNVKVNTSVRRDLFTMLTTRLIQQWIEQEVPFSKALIIIPFGSKMTQL